MRSFATRPKVGRQRRFARLAPTVRMPRNIAPRSTAALEPAFAAPAAQMSGRLEIGPAADAHEQEADRVADQVMRMPEPGAQTSARGGKSGSTPAARIQMKSEPGGGPAKTAPAIVHDVLRSPGHPLDPATRAFMEPRFGHDHGHARALDRQGRRTGPVAVPDETSDAAFGAQTNAEIIEESPDAISNAELSGGKRLKISHRTNYSAPDGSPDSRAKVAVGEVVTFKGNAAGAWTASAGTPASGASVKRFVWTAPNRAESVVIAFAVGAKMVTQTITVIEPNAITGAKLADLSYPAGIQGAGMTLKFNYHPKNVSFGNIGTKEVSGPATGIWGRYQRFNPKLLWHDADYYSKGKFLQIGQDNRDIGTDDVESSGVSHPWLAGGYEWVIPVRFAVTSETGDGKEFTSVKQTVVLEGATVEPESGTVSGRTTISKLGQSSTRMP